MKTELLIDHMAKQLRMPALAKQYGSLAREAEERNLRYEEYA